MINLVHVEYWWICWVLIKLSWWLVSWFMVYIDYLVHWIVYWFYFVHWILFVMFIKCFTCKKSTMWSHSWNLCKYILFCVSDKYFMVKCSFIIILYVKIFLSQSVPPLLNYTTIWSPLLSKCKFISKYLNLIFGIDFGWQKWKYLMNFKYKQYLKA